MTKVTSPINYNYATIKITQSRLDKGLIAIPMSLASFVGQAWRSLLDKSSYCHDLQVVG
jgi:hypothetical protein